MDDHVIFTVKYGTIHAKAGDKYGEAILQDGWYVIEKCNDRTQLVGPIDIEAIAILVRQEMQSIFSRTVGNAARFISL